MRLTTPGEGPEWIERGGVRRWQSPFSNVLLLVGIFCVASASGVSARPAAGESAGPKVSSSPASAAGKEGKAHKANPPAASPATASTGSNSSTNSGQPPEMAVVFDGSYRPPAKDLQLTLENERHAEADAHFIEGLLLEDTTDADKAQEEYLKSLALDPANVDLSIKLALEQLQRGDTPAAIGLLKDTIKAAPKKPQPYLALAYVYFKGLEKADLAQKYALQALDVDPGNIYVYQYLKEIYTALNQPPKIVALLDRAAKVDSRSADYWLELGEIYADFYLKGDAAKSPDNVKKTTAIFQKALALDSTSVDSLTRAAKFFVDTQQYAEAVPVYQKIIQIEPDQNNARENLARCFLNSNQRDKAIATLEEMIKLNPVQGQAYGLLGSIYEQGQEFDKASENYQQSLLVSPNQPENYRSLALLFLGRFNKPERAAEVLVEARRRFPETPLFSYLLAVSLTSAKKYQQALPIFEQALLEAQSSSPEILQGGEFYYQYGNAAGEAGLFDKATDLLRKSLETADNPQRVADSSNSLGYLFVEHEQNLEEAGTMIRKALEIDPDNGAFLDSMGWYYYKTNHYDKALVELMHAVEAIKPEDPVVYEHLGDTYSKLNDTQKAVSCWQKALGLNPEETNKTALTKKIEDSKAQLTQVHPAGT